MSKIPSMKSYVISETTKLYQNPDRNGETFSDHAEKLLKHVNLLDRPLRLGYYVPTLMNDRIFSEEQMVHMKMNTASDELKKYFADACQNIIFKDFGIKSESDNHIVIGRINAYFKMTWDKRTRKFHEFETIEEMVIYDFETNLTFD